MEHTGYKIKCRFCKCKFFIPLIDVRVSGFDGAEWVECPDCGKKMYKSIFWRKCKMETGE